MGQMLDMNGQKPILLLQLTQMQEKNTNLSQKYEENRFQRDFICIQEKILASFMKKACEDITKNELRIISESSLLLESLPKMKSLKSFESTEDCQSLWMSKSQNQLPTRPNSPNLRAITRKSPRAKSIPFDFAYSIELRDIEENCNPSTYSAISQLVRQFKKIKENQKGIQANEKRLNRRVQGLQKDEQNLAILKEILKETEQKIKKLETENSQLRKKNKEFLARASRSKESLAFQKGSVVKILQLTHYLREKEETIKHKMAKITTIEQEVLKIVENQITTTGCLKCCNFLKKIKDSILNLRKTLLEQSEQIESIYNRYKQSLCSLAN